MMRNEEIEKLRIRNKEGLKDRNLRVKEYEKVEIRSKRICLNER